MMNAFDRKKVLIDISKTILYNIGIPQYIHKNDLVA